MGRYEFTGHTDELCKALTLDRIRFTERALENAKNDLAILRDMMGRHVCASEPAPPARDEVREAAERLRRARESNLLTCTDSRVRAEGNRVLLLEVDALLATLATVTVPAGVAGPDDPIRVRLVPDDAAVRAPEAHCDGTYACRCKRHYSESNRPVPPPNRIQHFGWFRITESDAPSVVPEAPKGQSNCRFCSERYGPCPDCEAKRVDGKRKEACLHYEAADGDCLDNACGVCTEKYRAFVDSQRLPAPSDAAVPAKDEVREAAEIIRAILAAHDARLSDGGCLTYGHPRSGTGFPAAIEWLRRYDAAKGGA